MMKIQRNIKRTVNATLIALLAVTFLFADNKNDPGRFNGWQVVGPGGGDVRSIAIDPKDKNRLYITTLDSQVYSSSDAGKTWKYLVTFHRPQVTLDNILVDVEDSNSIYVSGHRHKDPGGFFYSRDAGKTWKEAKDLKNEGIHALAQSSANPNLLIAGSVGRVFISYNRGEDWKLVTNSSIEFIQQLVDSAAFDPKNPNIIYVGTSWRGYKSTDGGKTWRLIVKGMIDDSDVFAIDINPKNPDDIVASACSGIYRSLNGGELWEKVNGIPSQSRRTRAILRNPSGNGGVYAGTTEGFWMSANDGKTWSLTSQRELEVNSIAVHPEEPNKVYIGTNNYGLMVSTDGGRNFTIQNGNFTSRFIQQIIPDVEQPNRFYATSNNTATGGGFIFISDDGGQSWIPSNKNLSVIRIKAFALLQDKQAPNTIYIGTNIGMFRSLDRGLSWTQITAPKKKATAAKKKPVKTKKPVAPTPPVESNKVDYLKDPVRTLSYTNDGKNGIIAGTDKGIYRTYNINAGWEKLPFGDGMDDQVFAVHTPESDPNTIWAGTVHLGVFLSRDNGASWKRITGVPTEAPITAIETAPQKPSLVYVGSAQTFYVSRDGGETWTRRGGNLPFGTYNAILVNPNNPNEVFAGSSFDGRGGIYQSVDGGDTWRQLDSKELNLPTRRIYTLTLDPQNPNRILAGTHSSGIYRIERESTANSETGTRPRVANSGN